MLKIWQKEWEDCLCPKSKMGSGKVTLALVVFFSQQSAEKQKEYNLGAGLLFVNFRKCFTLFSIINYGKLTNRGVSCHLI
jgi:hypothetical protein